MNTQKERLLVKISKWSAKSLMDHIRILQREWNDKPTGTSSKHLVTSKPPSLLRPVDSPANITPNNETQEQESLQKESTPRPAGLLLQSKLLRLFLSPDL